MSTNQAILTTYVSRATQRRIHEIAKAQGVTVRAFGAIIFEQAVRDFDAGTLKIVTPEPTLERVTRKAKTRRPLDTRPCRD